MRHRSISERLRRAKSPESRRELLLDWTDNWFTEQMNIVQQLSDAYITMDNESICKGINQLRAMTDRRLSALSRIFVKLNNKIK